MKAYRIPESDMLSEKLERIVRMETKIESMAEVRETAEAAKEAALHALQAAKSAHHRLDEISDNMRWLWRMLVGSVLTAAVALLTNLNAGG